jgi:predicted dehydrogenase
VPPRDANVVLDSAVHDIDAMRFVLGAEVSEAFAMSQSGIVAEHENSLLGLLRFEPVEGVAAQASLEVNWLSPRRLRDLAVLGEKGAFVVDYAAQTLDFYPLPAVRSGPVQGWNESRAAGGGAAVRIPVEPREQLVQELQAFTDAVRCGGAMPLSPGDGLAALAIAEALTESARSRRPVRPERWSFDD